MRRPIELQSRFTQGRHFALVYVYLKEVNVVNIWRLSFLSLTTAFKLFLNAFQD